MINSYLVSAVVSNIAVFLVENMIKCISILFLVHTRVPKGHWLICDLDNLIKQYKNANLRSNLLKPFILFKERSKLTTLPCLASI